MRRGLRALLLAGAIGIGAAVPATTVWAAAPAASHAAAAKVVSVPQPGQGWLTGRKQRLLAVLVLLDVGAALLWYGSDTVRPPRLLGSVGAHRSGLVDPVEHDPTVRGIGRFARSRSRPPHRL
ncbi:MAG TPA: hypothetical protein VMU63_06970 [Acidimicrobiales bacterium]|nr:hypothetical protein [Acidimicrobiales bacterium]